MKITKSQLKMLVREALDSTEDIEKFVTGLNEMWNVSPDFVPLKYKDKFDKIMYEIEDVIKEVYGDLENT